MKDYLSNQERKDLIFLRNFVERIEKMLETWTNNLTKEEHRAIKTSITWGLKAYESILERQNKTSFKSIVNAVLHSNLRIEDKFATEMFQKKINTDLSAALEKNQEYYRLVELIIDRNCVNCKNHGAKCEFYKEFEKHCVPQADGYKTLDCKYSYVVEEKNKNI